MTQPVENLEQLLDRIGEAEDGSDAISLGRILEFVGRRSFGPILLLVGLITVTPIGGIPGLPSVLAFLVFVVAIQLLLQRDHFWLPQWLLCRQIDRGKIDKTLKWSRKPARFVDHLIKARLAFFTRGVGAYAIALVCLLIALSMPPMEFVPFSVMLAGITLLLFGLALIAHDGLMALIGLLFALASYGMLILKLF